MTRKLNGKKIAILVTDGFEESELLQPQEAFEEAGAETFIISPKEGKVKGWKDSDWGQTVRVDVPLAKALPDEYDALLLPGGVKNPDSLRMDKGAVGFVKKFVESGKPIAEGTHQNDIKSAHR